MESHKPANYDAFPTGVRSDGRSCGLEPGVSWIVVLGVGVSMVGMTLRVMKLCRGRGQAGAPGRGGDGGRSDGRGGEAESGDAEKAGVVRDEDAGEDWWDVVRGVEIGLMAVVDVLMFGVGCNQVAKMLSY
jgi:hypothetical protein